MANFSFVDHVGDGTTATFPFSFVGQGKGYIRDSDVYVYIDGVESLFVLSGENQVTMLTPPDDNSVIRIRRIMPKDEPFANFSRGNAFTQDLLNKSFLQTLYAYHEFLDGFTPTGDYYLKAKLSIDGLDLNGNKITEVGAGSDPTDAVNLGQLKEIVAVTLGVNIISEELPTGPEISNGVRWYKPSEATTYVYYCDEDSCQWVQEPVQSAEGTLREELGIVGSTLPIAGVPAKDLVKSVKSFARRDVASLISGAFNAAALKDTCVLQKLRTDYPEFAVYTPLSVDGRDWLRWLFTNRFNVGAAGATRMIGCTLAGLYPATSTAKTAANNVSEVTANAPTVTKGSVDGVKVGTWSTPATVLTTTDISWSATVGNTCTYSITGVERVSLRVLLAGNGGIGKVTIKTSGVEIAESLYALSSNHLVSFLASAVSTTTYHMPLAHGLNPALTYEVEIKVDTTNPAASRVYTAGLLGYDEIAFDDVGLHGIITDTSLAGQTNALSLAPLTTAVYQVTNATRIDWRYVQTTSGGIVVLNVYNAAGTLVASETLDTYATGSTAKSFTVIKNLPKGTYYLHVQNGKTKNAASTGYRYYDFGVTSYDETQAGDAGVDEFDNKDMPLNEQDPNNGTAWMLIGSGNLELAISARKPSDPVGSQDFIGGIHGHEDLNSIEYFADGVAIDFAGAAQFAKFTAKRFTANLDTTLKFISDDSDFCSVQYVLSLDKVGYGVGTTKTTLAPAIVHIDYSIMLNCPSTQIGNQAESVGGGFELWAADKNYLINSYDNSSTLVYIEQPSFAFINDDYTVSVNYTTLPNLPELFYGTGFVSDSYMSLVQDRTDRTIKGYTLTFAGNPTNGVAIDAGVTWSHTKLYRVSANSALSLVGL